MKKNPEKMAELWEKFPRLSTEDEDQIIHDALPQFLFYEKKANPHGAIAQPADVVRYLPRASMPTV